MAMCGRREVRTKKAMDSATPVISPVSTPNPSTVARVANSVMLSSLWMRQWRRMLCRSTMLTTDTTTMAASAAWGRRANSGVKNSRVSTITAMHTSALIWVRAPVW